MIKKIILLLLAAACIYGVGFSPYSVPAFLDNSAQLRETLAAYDSAKRAKEDSDRALVDSQNAFVDKRNFDVAHTDVDKIIEVLSSAMSITVSSVNTADPLQHFAPGSIWDGSEQPDAVIVSMAVEDSTAALRIIDKLQLPIYEITVSEPSMVNITFLTGGAGE